MLELKEKSYKGYDTQNVHVWNKFWELTSIKRMGYIKIEDQNRLYKLYVNNFNKRQMDIIELRKNILAEAKRKIYDKYILTPTPKELHKQNIKQYLQTEFPDALEQLDAIYIY